MLSQMHLSYICCIFGFGRSVIYTCPRNKIDLSAESLLTDCSRCLRSFVKTSNLAGKRTEGSGEKVYEGYWRHGKEVKKERRR